MAKLETRNVFARVGDKYYPCISHKIERCQLTNLHLPYFDIEVVIPWEDFIEEVEVEYLQHGFLRKTSVTRIKPQYHEVVEFVLQEGYVKAIASEIICEGLSYE